MKIYLDSIKTVLPKFTEEKLRIHFQDAGVDSIDLVTIRVEFEKILGSRIPDKEWLDFVCIGQAIDFCVTNSSAGLEVAKTVKAKSTKLSIVINMPQMALGALSENWLFKEIGGIHWDKICDGLGKSSFDLKDDLGNRLYATFVRIRLVCSENLRAFKENEVLDIDGKIKRFGESMYFSDLGLVSSNQSIDAELMTTFSIRNSTDNTQLAKSQPVEGSNTVEQFSVLPDFGNDYRLLKKGELIALKYNDLEFVIKDTPIFETEYELNPYYDLNGVSLLYFAAYPIINDVCEARYFNNNLELDGRWEQTYYTAYKDMFYFSNCNIDETIIYRLTDQQELSNGSIMVQSVLLRKSDMAIMAKVFTIKSKGN